MFSVSVCELDYSVSLFLGAIGGGVLKSVTRPGKVYQMYLRGLWGKEGGGGGGGSFSIRTAINPATPFRRIDTRVDTKKQMITCFSQRFYPKYKVM